MKRAVRSRTIRGGQSSHSILATGCEACSKRSSRNATASAACRSMKRTEVSVSSSPGIETLQMEPRYRIASSTETSSSRNVGAIGGRPLGRSRIAHCSSPAATLEACPSFDSSADQSAATASSARSPSRTRSSNSLPAAEAFQAISSCSSQTTSSALLASSASEAHSLHESGRPTSDRSWAGEAVDATDASRAASDTARIACKERLGDRMFAVMGHASMREAVASGSKGSNARCTRWKHEVRNLRKEVRSRSSTPHARRSLRSAERRE